MTDDEYEPPGEPAGGMTPRKDTSEQTEPPEAPGVIGAEELPEGEEGDAARWRALVGELKTANGPSSVLAAILEEVGFSGVRDGYVELATPNLFCKEQLEGECREVLETACRKRWGEGMKVRVLQAAGQRGGTAGQNSEAAGQNGGVAGAPPGEQGPGIKQEALSHPAVRFFLNELGGSINIIRPHHKK